MNVLRRLSHAFFLWRSDRKVLAAPRLSMKTLRRYYQYAVWREGWQR